MERHLLLSRDEVVAALDAAGGNRVVTAKRLGISRATLYRLLGVFGLSVKRRQPIGGRFDVIGPLGSGGEGRVFEVADRAGRHERLAAKLLRNSPGTTRATAAALREFRTLARLRHPGLVRVFDVGIDAASHEPYLVMELVPGVPFLDAAAQQSFRWVLGALLRVLDAIAHLHRNGLIHRDLKSENVLVDAGDDPDQPSRVTVMDLGLAERAIDPSGGAAGTGLYAAPELLLGTRATARSDLYAFGVLAYRALTGRFPYEAHSAQQALEAQRRGAPLPPSTLMARGSLELDHWLERLLALDPSSRFGDASAAREALAELTGGVDRDTSIRPRRVTTADFVGRDPELETLLDLLGGDATDVGAVCIVGEEGIGKTRLLEVALAECRAAGHAVVRGRCESGLASAGVALEELLDEALPGADGSGTSVADQLVEHHRAALAAAYPHRFGRGVTGDPPQREVVLSALVELFSGLANHRRLVIALDRFEQADGFLLDLIERLIRAADRTPLRCLLSTRQLSDDHDGARLLRVSGAEGRLRMIALGPLLKEDVRRLAEQILGGASALMLAPALFEASNGNPLLLMELLRDLAERDEPFSGLSNLPQTLQEMAQWRVQRVGADPLDVLAAIATAIGSARQPDLEQVTGLAWPALEAALTPLQQLRLCDRSSEGGYRIPHTVVRQAVLSRIGSTKAAEWHGRWGQVLAMRPDRVVERAEHCIAAGTGAAAHNRTVLSAAIDELERGWRHAAAIPLYEQWLAGFDRDDRARLELYVRLERACHRVRDVTRAADVCQRWAELAQLHGDGSAAARALSLLAARRRDAGDWNAAEAAAREAMTRAANNGDDAVHRLAERILASTLWIEWRHEEAGAHYEALAESVAAGGAPRERALYLNDCALALASSGRGAAALEALRESERLFRELGDTAWATALRTTRSACLQRLGELDKAVEEARLCCDEMRALGAAIPVELALEHLALLLVRLGRFEQALVVCDDLADEALRYGRQAFRVSALLTRGEALVQLDEPGLASEHAALALELATSYSLPAQAGFARIGLAAARRRAGQWGDAIALAERAYADASRERSLRREALAACELIRIAQLERRVGDAVQWVDRAGFALRVAGEDGGALRARWCLERARVRQLQGQHREARADALEAAATAERFGPHAVRVEALSLAAELHGAAGEAELAAWRLNEARRAIESAAATITDPSRRARYLARPDHAVTLQSSRAAARGGGRLMDGSALSALLDSSRRLVSGGELGAFLKRTLEVAVRQSGAEHGALFVFDARSGQLTVAAAVGLEAATQRDALQISRSVVDRADRGEVVVVRNARTDPRLAGSRSVVLFGIRSVICVPLRVGDEVLGALYVDSRVEHAPLEEPQQHFLEALAAHAAFALANGRLLDQVRRERDALKQTRDASPVVGSLVGTSPRYKQLLVQLQRVAMTELSVIVQGESGAGKEAVARALHELSRRRRGPLQIADCASIPATLLEATLLGHARGAFTGADRDRAGLFEQAHGGTLLFDGLTELDPQLQAKLLRVLQDHTVRPLGAVRDVAVDVRVVVLTREPLTALVESGRLRSDLYYRLGGTVIDVPALREHKEDVPALLRHFLSRAVTESAARGGDARPIVPEVDAGVVRALMHHEWPGNVRELEGLAKRMLIYAEAGRITVEGLRRDPDLAAMLMATLPARGRSSSRGSVIQQELRERIETALTRCRGNKDRAAERLGISRATLYRWIRDLGLRGSDR